MVKVQKPKPKELKKTSRVENISPSSGKIQKKPKKNKDQPKKLITEAVGDKKPVNAPKKSKTKEKNVADKLKKEKKGEKPAKNKQNQKQTDLPKKPLVLAPSPSPSSSSKALKRKQKRVKKAIEKSTNIETSNVAKAKGPEEKPKKELTKMQRKKANIRAFKKLQNKNKKQQQQGEGKKKPKAQPTTKLEAVPFDEDAFNTIVTVENIRKIAKALKTQVEQEVAKKKTSIFDDYHYFLNVSCFKIPSCPKRMVKLSLKNSLVDKDDDVAIVVADLQRGAKVDYEPTIEHYENIFREAGIEGLTIIPFNKLRNECNTFEAVRKFGNTYDYFLCDGRLAGQLAGFCGKVFQKPRTTFHTVRMDSKNLKNEVEKALRRTAYKQLHKGDLISMPVGSHKFTMLQLAENVHRAVEQLKTLYPGGLGNIRSMNLKIDIVGTSSLPIYISTAQPPADTPYVVGPREQRLLKLKREANEVLSKFTITKEAEIIKLNKIQVERKRKLKEAKAQLLVEDAAPVQISKNGNSDVDDDEDDEKSDVPAKKARKEKESTEVKNVKKENLVKSTKDSKKVKSNKAMVKEEESEEEDSGNEDEENEDGGESEDDDNEDDENDDENEIANKDEEDDEDDDDDDDESGDEDEDEDVEESD